MEQKRKIFKWFSKCPTLLPMIAIIIHELVYWEIIGNGNRSKQFLELAVFITVVILFLGYYEKRIWRAPLIGVLIWVIIGLFDFRRVEPLLFIALFVLTLASIVVKFKYKIPIPTRAWVFSILFIGILFGLFFDHSDSIKGNLFFLMFEIDRWIVISIPFIIFDAALNKKLGWQGYLVYTSWLPFAVLLYPVARITLSNETIDQVLGACFWILTTVVFFVLIPLIHGTRGEKRNKELTIVCISTVAIVIVSIVKWFFLEEPFDLVSPPWIMVIKYCLLLCFPLLLLHSYYKESLGEV